MGKFYGIKTTIDNVIFNINWELNSPIILPSIGNYTLQFYIHYNCYETGIFLPGFLSISDKLTIYKKSLQSETFMVIKEYNFLITNSTTKWEEYKIDLVLNESSLYLKFRFERITSVSYATCVFAIDDIKLLHDYPGQITTSEIFSNTTSNTFSSITSVSTIYNGENSNLYTK